MNFKRTLLLSAVSLIAFLFIGYRDSPLFNLWLSAAVLGFGVIGPWLWFVAVRFAKLADEGYRASKRRQAHVDALHEEYRYSTDPVAFYLKMRNQGVSVFDMAARGNQEDLSMYIAGHLMHSQAYTQQEAFRLVGKDRGMLAILALAEELGIDEETVSAPG